MITRVIRKVKRIALKVLDPVIQKRREYAIEKFSNYCREIIRGYGYEEIELLGEGKDGLVYKVEKDNAFYVIKVLSQYGKHFLPLTASFISKKIKDDCFYDVAIIDNKILIYDYEALDDLDINPTTLLEFYIKICDLQLKLLEKNLVYWDLGFQHLNFMKVRGEEQIKLIDYGGNAFLQIEPEVTLDTIEKKRNLIYANSDFIRYILIAHLITHGVGKTTFRSWASSIQVDFSELETLRKTADKILLGSSFDEIYKFVLNTNFLTIEGWSGFRELLKAQVSSNKIFNLEDADIDEVTYESELVRVRGYQNYDLTCDMILPLNIGHSWTLSEKKFNLVQKAMQMTHGNTYLDIGSNLGMYVFAAGVRNGMDATGLDYNSKYIKECNKISEYLNFRCRFGNTSFTAIEEEYDVVSCLGVIHHIYQRTENFGSLKPILERLAGLSRVSLIVEFPTERDAKAIEWTNISTRKIEDEYSLEKFLRYGQELFGRIELIGYVTNERPIYLLTK